MAFEQALLDPSKFFDNPREIVESEDLTWAQKLQLLKCWETDARLLQEAANEGMIGGEQPHLAAVRREIETLSAAV